MAHAAVKQDKKKAKSKSLRASNICISPRCWATRPGAAYSLAFCIGIAKPAMKKRKTVYFSIENAEDKKKKKQRAPNFVHWMVDGYTKLQRMHSNETARNQFCSLNVSFVHFFVVVSLSSVFVFVFYNFVRRLSIRWATHASQLRAASQFTSIQTNFEYHFYGLKVKSSVCECMICHLCVHCAVAAHDRCSADSWQPKLERKNHSILFAYSKVSHWFELSRCNTLYTWLLMTKRNEWIDLAYSHIAYRCVFIWNCSFFEHRVLWWLDRRLIQSHWNPFNVIISFTVGIEFSLISLINNNSRSSLRNQIMYSFRWFRFFFS